MDDPERPLSSNKGTMARMLDLFSHPVVETASERYYEDEVELETALSGATKQLVFKSPPTNHFTDLKETKLELTVKITTNNGGDLPASHPPPPPRVADQPAPRAAEPNDPGAGFDNLTHAVIFKETDIRLGGTSISPMTGYYAHTAYFHTILSYQRDAVKSRLPLQGFFLDADSNSTNVFGADGFAYRAGLTTQSREYSLSGPIHHGLFFQEKLIPPMIGISVVMTLSEPAFALKSGIANFNGKFEVTEAKLVLKRLVVNPSIQAAFEARFVRQPCIYPINYLKTQSFLVEANKASYQVNDVWSGNFPPRRTFVAIVPQTNMVGSFTSSPFKFSHQSVRDMYFRLGPMRVPSIPFDVNFARTTPRFDRLYSALFGNSGQNEDSGIMIKPANFVDNFCIFSFDFNQQDTPDAFVPKQVSPCLFHIDFVTAPTETMVVLLFSVSEQIISIDSSRNTILNFAL